MSSGFWSSLAGLALTVPFVAPVEQLPAQSDVVPRGHGSLHGFGSGGLWDAEKSRRVVLIDRSQFPWGAGNPGVINGFRLRRTGGVVVEMASIQKPVRVRVSATAEASDGSTPQGPRADDPQAVLEQNHGQATPTLCFAGNWSFPSQPRLMVTYQGCAVPFGPGSQAEVTFSTPFQVPADADTLVLDIEVEHAAGFSFDPAWWPEELSRSFQPREFLGGFRRLTAPCPTVTCSDGSSSAPCMDRCNATGLHIGAQFETDFRVGAPNEFVLGWIGLILPTPGFFPVTSCPYHVEPATCQYLGSSDPSSTELHYIWGTIPPLPFLIGFPIGVQFAVFPTTLGGQNAVLSGAYELEIGPPPSGDVEFSTVVGVCDSSGNLSSPPCTASDPFAPGATGVAGDTPVLQLF